MPALKAGRQRGQVLAYVSIVAPLLLLPVTAYAVETTRLAAAQAALQGVAATAAEDGVQQVDVDGFRAGGPLQPAPAQAEGVVRAEVRVLAPGDSVDNVAISGTGLTVALSEKVPLMFAGFLGPPSVTLHAQAGALLRAGY